MLMAERFYKRVDTLPCLIVTHGQQNIESSRLVLLWLAVLDENVARCAIMINLYQDLNSKGKYRVLEWEFTMVHYFEAHG